MKIAMLTDRLTMGGLETHIVSFSNELLRRGHHILLYTQSADPPILSLIRHTDGLFSHLNWRNQWLSDLRSFRPDIIHAHPFAAIGGGFQAAHHLKKPWVATIHGLYDVSLGSQQMGIIRQVARIIAVDDGVSSYLQGRIHLPEKISVIYNGIDLDTFKPMVLSPAQRESFGLHPEWLTIATLGRFEDGKEQPVFQLLRCAPQLAQIRGGLNLLLIGDGSCFREIQQQTYLTQQYNPLLNVYLTGRQSDVREFIAMADIVIACDRAAMEVMACRRPVLAANASGFAGVIDINNFKDIMLFRKGYRPISDGHLVESIKLLAYDEGYREWLSLNGLNIVSKYFDITKKTSQLEEVYQTAISSKTVRTTAKHQNRADIPQFPRGITIKVSSHRLSFQKKSPTAKGGS